MNMNVNIYPNPRKTTTMRALGKVDVTALRDAVLAIPEDVWQAENNARKNSTLKIDPSVLLS